MIEVTEYRLRSAYFVQMNEKKVKTPLLYQWKLWLLASLTLGLAPFSPEPHIWGKVKWIWGGVKGMQVMDWLDFIMHGTPWLLLLLSFVLHIVKPLPSD